jgi:hypothetical protein
MSAVAPLPSAKPLAGEGGIRSNAVSGSPLLLPVSPGAEGMAQ